MRHYVAFQIPQLSAWIIAQCALLQPLFGVNGFIVALQISTTTKLLIALFAMIRFFPGMFSEVYFQTESHNAWKITKVTFLWFLPCVYQNVSLQTVGWTKWRIALLTFIRFVCLVSKKMRFQVTHIESGITAQVAVMRLLLSTVRIQVQFQGVTVTKWFVALITCSWFFSDITHFQINYFRKLFTLTSCFKVCC